MVSKLSHPKHNVFHSDVRSFIATIVKHVIRSRDAEPIVIDIVNDSRSRRASAAAVEVVAAAADSSLERISRGRREPEVTNINQVGRPNL